MSSPLATGLCVIGTGSDAVAAAVYGAMSGAAVTLVGPGPIGRESKSGGLASAALIASARRAEALRAAKPLGINVPRPKIDFYQVHDHIDAVLAAAAPDESRARLAALGVRIVERAARFKDGRTLAAGTVAITARRFIVATGSVPVVPAIPGLKEASYLTEDTIFELLICPKQLVVVGATPEGLALAQAYRRLGAEATVLDAGQPLADEDPECAAVVLDQLAREGVTVRGGVTIERIKTARTRTQILLGGSDEGQKLEASHLLLACGRRPNIDDLDLAAAGIKATPDGLAVDGHLRTSNKRIYAIGAAVAGACSASFAEAHARIAVRHALFRRGSSSDANSIPRVTCTDPELAHVGLTETEVRQAGGRFHVFRWPYRENDKARAERRTTGHIKVIASERGKILGATVVGDQAGEVIGAWALAVNRGMHVDALADLAFPHPAYGEIGKRAVANFLPPSLLRIGLRRLRAFRPLRR